MTDVWDGLPERSSEDGWHWLTKNSGARPFMWRAEYHDWFDEAPFAPERVACAGWNYLGPCFTPTEVAAREREAEIRALEDIRTKLRNALEEAGTAHMILETDEVFDIIDAELARRREEVAT